VVPGYLGSNKVVEKWAKIAHANKVMMVTDFLHLDGPDDVMEMFEDANLTSGDAYKSNVMMACNWLVGRGKFSEIGEDEDLFVPPSTALAGKVYQTLMSQVTAGKKHGSLNEVDGVCFDLKKSEIANLEKLGLIPMVNEYGKVMAFSAKTLFNGDNLGLQTYSVVRVFDYIMKVLMDFLNRRAFENFNASTKKDLQSQIVKFLDSITGPKSLIENFTIKRFEQDPVQKDRIYLDIHMTPYFPAKSFMIKLDGQKGDSADGVDWKSSYDQQK
jgi:Type VI secretion system, TssC, VipB